jgi:glutamine synthetase
MTAQNAHRLGAGEAPPTIISAFLGSHLTEVLNKLEESSSEEAIVMVSKKQMKLGVAHIPEVLLDNTDRNRTSPFAFTGNRFEFRAVGSSANCASALIVLNTIMADQLNEFKNLVDEKIASGIPTNKAIFEVLRAYIKESKSIRFDGNGYSDEWRKEAAERGLDCETSVPLIYEAYTRKESIDMFSRTGVFSEKELEARNEVKWETYTKKLQIEARVLGDLCLNHIIPVATQYQSLLLDNVYKTKQIYNAEKAEELSAHNMELIEKLSKHISIIKSNVDAMVEARKLANKIESERDKAIAYSETVLPYFSPIRANADELELIVDDELWPLPKYREMLFIR